jgi:hypothetical protein
LRLRGPFIGRKQTLEALEFLLKSEVSAVLKKRLEQSVREKRKIVFFT